MGALPVKETEQSFTYADYKNWELKEGERYEVIHGEVYAMSAPTTLHQEILTEILNQFYNYLKGKPCRVYPAPFDVRPFFEEDESDDTVIQPDISVICNKEKRGPEGCRGAPDLVVEVLSPSNTAIEMGRKFFVYQKAGVREYWVVNPDHKLVQVHCFSEGPTQTYSYKANDKISVKIFPDLVIDLEQVFG